MRLQQYLNDEYDGRFKGKYESTEIFVNPSKSEFRDASKNGEVRFFAYNKTKKFYIWNPEVLHGDVIHDYIGISDWNGRTEDTYFLKGQTLQGVARRIGGKWQFYDSDVIGYVISDSSRDFSFDQFIEMLESKWNWVKKYISFDYIKKNKLGGYWES